MTRTAAVSAVAETASAALAIPSVTPPSPAVVLSINPGTLSAVSHPGDKTAEQRVNSLAEAVKTHNDIADAVAQVDWAKFAKIAGPEKAECPSGIILFFGIAFAA
jgi:hypothetical protein